MHPDMISVIYRHILKKTKGYEFQKELLDVKINLNGKKQTVNKNYIEPS